MICNSVDGSFSMAMAAAMGLTLIIGCWVKLFVISTKTRKPRAFSRWWATGWGIVRPKYGMMSGTKDRQSHCYIRASSDPASGYMYIYMYYSTLVNLGQVHGLLAPRAVILRSAEGLP